MKYDRFTVGPGIGDLHRKSDYTLGELSEKTGISISALKRIEQGTDLSA